MADQEWIKNLAGADVVAGSEALEPQDEGAVRQLLTERIESTVDRIFSEMTEACQVFNFYVGKDEEINLYRLAANAETPANGFTIMQGKYHIRFIYQNGHLTSKLAHFSGYDEKNVNVRQFKPFVDRFGSLLWKMNDIQLMDQTMIVKQLLEDLVTAFRQHRT